MAPRWAPLPLFPWLSHCGEPLSHHHGACACLEHQCQEQALNLSLPASKSSSMACRHGVPNVIAASLQPCSPHYSASQKPQTEDPPVCWRVEIWQRKVGLMAGAGGNREAEGGGLVRVEGSYRSTLTGHRGLSVSYLTHI